MTPRQAKEAAMRTDCRNLTCEGLYLSEPIPTRDAAGIVDEFFVYAKNKDGTMVSRPLARFGIRADDEKVAYVERDPYDPNEGLTESVVDERNFSEKFMREYERLYEKVRGFVLGNCSEEERKVLQKYVERLFEISGKGLWENYGRTAPNFFEWAKGEGIDVPA